MRPPGRFAVAVGLLLLAGCGERANETTRVAADAHHRDVPVLAASTVRQLVAEAASCPERVARVLIQVGPGLRISELRTAEEGASNSLCASVSINLTAATLAFAAERRLASADFRMLPNADSTTWLNAIFGSAARNAVEGERSRLVSVIQPEYVTKTTVHVHDRKADGQVHFHAPGSYAGRVQFTAVFEGTRWRVMGLSYPASGLGVALTNEGWRLQ